MTRVCWKLSKHNHFSAFTFHSGFGPVDIVRSKSSLTIAGLVPIGQADTVRSKSRSTVAGLVPRSRLFSYSVLGPSRLGCHPVYSPIRTFIAARIKWAWDPYLDTVVSREKNLLPCLTLKNILLSFPNSSPPSISSVSVHKPLLNLPTPSPLSFIQKYPSLFTISHSNPHFIVKLTPQFLTLHNEKRSLHTSPLHRHAMAGRLSKFLTLTRACKLPLCIIDDFKFDLGLPANYLLDLVPYYPKYFRVCTLEYNGNLDVGLELVKWRGEFATPAVLRDSSDCRRGRTVKFPMSFAPGFVLQKRVLDWLEEWQCLPYISPYENAFHLAPKSDQAEKWTVSVLHEIMSVLISKKTETTNVLRLGDYLGFGMRFKKALVHYPGLFYLSHKIRTQTVVIREAFRKDVLLERNPLMGMRHQYIYLMSKSGKGRKFVKKLSPRIGWR